MKTSVIKTWTDRMNEVYNGLTEKKLNTNEAFAKIAAAGKIAQFASIELKNKIRTNDSSQLSFLSED